MRISTPISPAGPSRSIFLPRIPLPGVTAPSAGDPSTAFITKLSPYGDALYYSVYLGGTGEDAGMDIAVDSDKQVYVTGWTTSADFPVTGNALQQNYGGNTTDGFGDAFVHQLNSSGNNLIYSTYLGGTWEDYGRAIRLIRPEYLHHRRDDVRR